uniref:ADP-ribosylation factor-binding protein GGA3 isoform X2 n=1 Tax=Geotrypetes seraphini TaxID=260995 RepID=A0A6P8SKM6_GEOSA|nr:ADP-ribosylation factor-binding protein GGA3 isoform X2 [Geotrypetes seraphini]
MAEAEGESLESWLNKATNPCNRQEDWEYIIGFCDQINKELEGPQIAVRLLAHKIQSPQEWEAVQALTVLEACMKNCGRRFHNEVGKFRFLNELIKVVSPKYLGDRVSEKVKVKVVELLYSWTVALPEESKIKDAYHMLKRQGIVLSDPLIPVDRTLIPSPPPRPKNPVFDDEEKSKDEVRMQKVTKRLHTLEEVNNNVKLLHEMLAHYNKDDSSEADKELMKELFERCETKRRTLFKLASETEDNDNSLGDILQASDNLSRVINSYKKIVEGQVINGETNFPALATEDSQPSSNLSTLIDLVQFDVSSPPPPPPPLPVEPALQPPLPLVIPILPPPPTLTGHSVSRLSGQVENILTTTNSLSLLDEELLCLGLNDPAPSSETESAGNSQWNIFQNNEKDLDFFGAIPEPTVRNSAANTLLQPSAQSMCGVSAPVTSVFPLSQTLPSGIAPNLSPFSFPSEVAPVLPGSKSTHAQAISGGLSPTVGSSALHELEVLGQQLLKEAKGTPAHGNSPSSAFHAGATLTTTVSTSPLIPSTGEITVASGAPSVTYPVGSSSTAGPGSPLFQQHDSPLKGSAISLGNVHIPLESIKPSSTLPVTAYDKSGFRILLHFASECPPGRPDVLVVVVSMLNTAPLPIKNIVLQAAVPKSMKVKLQPPSGTELSPFNPIHPPAAITQVMLLANPMKEKVRLRYRLAFTLGEQSTTEVGEVDQFPPVEKWGNL